MKYCLVRKVPYRLPGTARIVFALVLKEREGLALLFCRKMNKEDSNALVIATENVALRVFESANVSEFPLEDADLITAANTLEAVGHGIAKSELEDFFKSEDDLF